MAVAIILARSSMQDHLADNVAASIRFEDRH
jgi:hypothetical protein